MTSCILLLAVAGLFVLLIFVLRQARHAHEEMDRQQNTLNSSLTNSGASTQQEQKPRELPVYDQAFLDTHSGAMERAIREMNKDNERWLRGSH